MLSARQIRETSLEFRADQALGYTTDIGATRADHSTYFVFFDVWLKNYVCDVYNIQSNKCIIYKVLIRYQYTQCTRDITGCLFLVKWKTVPIVVSNRVCSESDIYFQKST